MAAKDTSSNPKDPQDVIDAYKKRQKMMPMMVWGVAIALLAIGVILLVIWLTSGSGKGGLFPTKTPTPTATFTPTPVTPTSTATIEPTVTNTSEPSMTPTRSLPMEYIVKAGDNCFDIAVAFDVSLPALQAINGFALDACPIQAGGKILIPVPGQELPTATPIPSDLPSGTRINYVVQLNDTLWKIASLTNSTVEDIMAVNKITDMLSIQAGQLLVVRVNITTPTPTSLPSLTATQGTPVLTAVPLTATPEPTK